MDTKFNRIPRLNNHNNRKQQQTVSQEVLMERAPPDDSPDQPTTPGAAPQLAVPHACSSYEQLGYHISWSPSRQHSRIRELCNQIARLGVSPHSVGWGPVLFWTELTEGNWARYKCTTDESKHVGRYSVLAYLKDKS